MEFWVSWFGWFSEQCNEEYIVIERSNRSISESKEQCVNDEGDDAGLNVLCTRNKNSDIVLCLAGENDMKLQDNDDQSEDNIVHS